MEKTPIFIIKNFLYSEKNYQNIQEFNEDLVNLKKFYSESSSSPNLNISDYKDKFQWDIEANYEDKEVVECFPKGPPREQIEFERKFTYYVVNRSTSKIQTQYTKIEKGILEDPSKLRHISGIYSLKFIKKENLDDAIEVRFGDENGRVEVLDLNK